MSEIHNITSLPQNKKYIFVSGISGQDGSYMVEYLLKNTTNYDIIGGTKYLFEDSNYKHIRDSRFHSIKFDINDAVNVFNIVSYLKPCYFFNFCGKSNVGDSWNNVKDVIDTNSTSLVYVLELIRTHAPHCRFFNAGSSEEFGNPVTIPQRENHPLIPTNPYGLSKVSSRNIIKMYRSKYNLYALQGWLYNHESFRRPEVYVTKKIVSNLMRIGTELMNNKTVTPFSLGNINSRRDWSYVEDIMDGIWRMMNQELFREDLQYQLYMEGSYSPVTINPLREYIFGSGKSHSIREFVERTAKTLNLDGEWKYINGKRDIDERFVIKYKGMEVYAITIDVSLMRKNDISNLLSDSYLARTDLKWENHTLFGDMITKMASDQAWTYPS